MEPLKDLLERISRTLRRDESIKESFSKIIFEETGIKINPQSIEYKDGVLFISANPVIKNQIALKEAAIKSKLKNVSRINYR